MDYMRYLRNLLPLLVFLSIMGLGGAIMAARAMRRRPIERRLLETPSKAPQPVLDQGQPRLFKALYSLGGLVAPRGPSKGLRDEMARAGLYARTAPLTFLGVKMVSFGAGL